MYGSVCSGDGDPLHCRVESVRLCVCVCVLKCKGLFSINLSATLHSQLWVGLFNKRVTFKSYATCELHPQLRLSRKASIFFQSLSPQSHHMDDTDRQTDIRRAAEEVLVKESKVREKTVAANQR